MVIKMKFDLKKTLSDILVMYPKFGTILANIYIEEDERVGTACTNGEYIKYNQKFMDSLKNEKEHMFLICHELFHIAFNHPERRINRNQELWNDVIDAVDNAHLMHDGLPLPSCGGVNVPWAYDYDAETLYDMLYQDYQLMKKFQKEVAKSLENALQDGLGRGVRTSHDMWGENFPSKSTSSDSNDSNSKGNQSSNGKGSSSEEDEKIKKRKKENLQDAQEELTKLGEKKAFEENEKDKKEQLAKLKKQLIDNSIDKSSKLGNGSGTYIRDLGIIGLGQYNKIIDWRYLLTPSITSYKMDWSYHNAEIEDGVLRPYLLKEPFAETEIVVDVSCSIGDELLKAFLYECKHIMQISKVKIGFFDTEFYGFKELRRQQDIDKIEIPGGGGTDFDVAVNAFSRRVINRIIFTDGYANMPKNKLKVIWVVFGNNMIDPQGSKVIYVDENKLVKKYRDKSLAKR